MSAGKRLAKRSIVGTRVGALYKETGYYKAGMIIGSKNNDELNFHNNSGSTGITPNSRYIVKFDGTPVDVREFSESELIGPGFKSLNNLKLRSGQKIYITHNGREVNGTVVYHQQAKDEVLINIQPQPCTNGANISSAPLENPIDVTKKLDEVRLLESRKSARLLDQDFDFARMADVADRKRSGSNSSSTIIVSTNTFSNNGIITQQNMMTTTASIDVPKTNNLSRKRRPSSGLLFQPVGLMQQQQQPAQQQPNNEVDGTDECAAAMVLMSLSCSPHSPHWDNGMISSSWSSSSSGASSWLSGASFGSSSNGNGILMPSSTNGIGIGSGNGGGDGSSTSSHHSNHSSNSPADGELFQLNNFSPTPSSSDDGIESDNGGAASIGGTTGGAGTTDVFSLGWDEPRKKKTKLIFKCTWPGCTMIKESCIKIESHVRSAHLGPKHDGLGDHEEEFYYTEVETPNTISNKHKSCNNSDFSISSTCSSSSPLGLSFMAFSPTLSHMDMVRPPSEDPAYKLSQLHNNIQRKSPNGTGNTQHHYLNHIIGTTGSNNPKKRLSPKSSPVRRPRGDTKKCRKVYGMDHRELWCTQCKWKKACTRFSD